MSERIKTLHPQGKAGVNIEKTKYDTVAQAITEALATQNLTFTQLTEAVSERLADTFDGSIGWYTTTVKLDLEARGTIERIAGKSPQVIRLVKV